MKIWVDADACPVVVREILFRAAERTGVSVTLVANHNLPVPASHLVNMLQVPHGFDSADDEIVRRSDSGDLVITADIPLAAELISKDVLVLTPRGERYTDDNIKSRLNMRDFMDTMRSSGMESSGPPTFSQRERQKFANALDAILAKRG